MLFPVVDLATRYRERIRRDLAPIFFVGLFWLAIKTFTLEYLFSRFGFFLQATPDLRHPTSLIYSVYLWIRRTGVGEITPVFGTAYRIFMQSYVYAVAAWLIAFVCYMTRNARSFDKLRIKATGQPHVTATPDSQRPTPDQWAWWIMFASTFLLAISLSRSLWIGIGIGMLVAISILLFGREGVPIADFIRRLWGPITAKAVALILFSAIIAPTPILPLFFGRASIAEPAAASRWALLPKLVQKIKEHPILGSGFGATVTYVTKDPRILESHPYGVYTTYAFEWGWLEHWVKFGIFGIPVMMWILISLGRRLWRSAEPFWFRAGAVSSLVALGMLHVFTPYLNHPLGFLYLFVGEGIIARNDTGQKTSK